MNMFKNCCFYILNNVIFWIGEAYDFIEDKWPKELDECNSIMGDDRIISSFYNNETNMIKVTYAIGERQHMIVFDKDDTIDRDLMKALLLQPRRISGEILTAEVNDGVDYTHILKKVAGPANDFHKDIVKIKIKYILDEKDIEKFTSLTYITEDGDIITKDNIEDYIY